MSYSSTFLIFIHYFTYGIKVTYGIKFYIKYNDIYPSEMLDWRHIQNSTFNIIKGLQSGLISWIILGSLTFLILYYIIPTLKEEESLIILILSSIFLPSIFYLFTYFIIIIIFKETIFPYLAEFFIFIVNGMVYICIISSYLSLQKKEYNFKDIELAKLYFQLDHGASLQIIHTLTWLILFFFVGAVMSQFSDYFKKLPSILIQSDEYLLILHYTIIRIITICLSFSLGVIVPYLYNLKNILTKIKDMDNG